MCKKECITLFMCIDQAPAPIPWSRPGIDLCFEEISALSVISRFRVYLMNLQRSSGGPLSLAGSVFCRDTLLFPAPWFCCPANPSTWTPADRRWASETTLGQSDSLSRGLELSVRSCRKAVSAESSCDREFPGAALAIIPPGSGMKLTLPVSELGQYRPGEPLTAAK